MDPIQLASIALAGVVLAWSSLRYRRSQQVTSVARDESGAGPNERIEAVDFYWRPG